MTALLRPGARLVASVALQLASAAATGAVGSIGAVARTAPALFAFSLVQLATHLGVLLLVGERLREPVAMGGPIVMNYDWEIDEAYRELQAGTFLKRRKS